MLFHEAWKGQFWQRTPIFHSDNSKIVGFASCTKITIFLLCLSPHNRRQTWQVLCRFITAATIKILIERSEGRSTSMAHNSCGTSLLLSMETNWNAPIIILLINSEMFFVLCSKKMIKIWDFTIYNLSYTFLYNGSWVQVSSHINKALYPLPERQRQTNGWDFVHKNWEEMIISGRSMIVW